MGEISDMLSAIKELKDTASDGISGVINATNRVIQPSSGSISAKALQGTANFAVLVSDSLDIDDGLMIGKSLEQRFATFLLTVLTMNPYMGVSGKEMPSAAKYLKQFHQNMGTKFEINNTEAAKMIGLGESTFDSVSESMSSFIIDASDNLGIDYNCWITESLQIASAIYEGVSSKGIDMDNAKFNYTIEEITEQSLLNSKGVMRPSGLMEAYATGKSPRGKDIKWGDRKQLNHLPNNEFKKSNDSVPTLLHVRVYPYDTESKRSLEPLDFVIGVKATLHQVSSADMISNIASGLSNSNTFFNFVKWTTGETKFFKDFLLMLDQNKMDAANANSSSGWWSALRRRKASSSLRKFAKSGAILPNATIVCTTDDLLALKESYGFDLTGADTGAIYRLMSKFFLISFIRVNPALQRVDMLFDGNSQFEVASYSTISKEIGKDDKKFKEMMKLLGRSA